MRGLLGVVAAAGFAVACGKTAADRAQAAPAGAGGPVSAEAQCLADAAAPREPKADAPERIEVAHILVRHAELARPEGSIRTRGQACLRALAARRALESGRGWEDVYAEFSDEKSATDGNLGSVAQSDLEPRFAAAAFALAVDELSYVVETDRGFHVIVRLE